MILKRALSILGLLIVLFIALVIYNNHFSKLDAKGEVQRMYANARMTSHDTITADDLKKFPEPVRRYLQYSRIVGTPKLHMVRLKQQGQFQIGPNRGWNDFEAVQYYTIDPPAFIWFAHIQMYPGVWITVRDKYDNGKGNMLVKPLSTFTIADAKGAEMDQGAMLRYLSEIVWFPGAWLSSYLTWEAIDSSSVRVTMSYYDMKVSGELTFSSRGELVDFRTERYRAVGDKFELAPWVTPVLKYSEMNGVMIPSEGEAIWKLKDGDFSYIRLKVTEIDYNTPTLYE
ncbi:MAG: hypothetical protein PHP42_04280 [Bacteroidota bacterium]|nr:hypothetical protein [Bacteroidota bacterium]